MKLLKDSRSWNGDGDEEFEDAQEIVTTLKRLSGSQRSRGRGKGKTAY